MPQKFSDRFRIKKAKQSDSQALALLLHKYYLYEHSLDKRVEIELVSDLKQELVETIRKGVWKFLLLTSNNQAIGWIDYKVSKENGAKTGILGNVFLLDKYRGRGLGKILFGRVLNQMRQQKCVVVRSGVYAKNERAQKFWQERGFTIDFEPTTYRIRMKL